MNQWVKEQVMARWTTDSMTQCIKQCIDGSVNQWMSELVSRWVNESAKQWKNEYWTDDESINQCHSQSMHQFTASMICELVSRWTNESTKRCIIEPMIQWIRTWMIQWIDELMSHFKKKSEPVSRWIHESVNQWIQRTDESMNRWLNDSMMNHLINEPCISLSRWISESMNQPGGRGGVEWSGVALGTAEVGSLFPQVRGSVWESCCQKSVHGCSKSSISFQHVKKLAVPGHFSRWGRQNVHRTVASNRFALQNHQKKEGRGPTYCSHTRMATTCCWQVDNRDNMLLLTWWWHKETTVHWTFVRKLWFCQ